MVAFFRRCDSGKGCERTFLGTFVTVLGIGMYTEAHMGLCTPKAPHVQLASSPFPQAWSIFFFFSPAQDKLCFLHRRSWAGRCSSPEGGGHRSQRPAPAHTPVS